MTDNFYWLISITTDSARVSLVGDKVLSQGSEIVWDSADSESLLKAIDTSLSSQNGDSTSNCAFIVPPTWIGEDGKMFPQMLDNLKYICKKLKLHPLGQISHDEAFVESYNNDDSFPSSYILIYFSPSHYQISLVYLGEIKKRHIQKLSENFLVSELEQILYNLNFSSALPPKIIITGEYTNEIIDDLKNYNWLSHKDTETFLHLPDVVSVDLLTLDQIFVNTINKQINNVPKPNLIPEEIIDSTPIDDIEEITADSIGFTPEDSPIEVNTEQSVLKTEISVLPKKIFKPKINFSFPKFNINYYWLFPFTFLPLLPVIPLFFAKIDLTIYQSPVEFSENFDVNLNSKTNASTQTFDLSVGVSIPTTGKKEIGEKSTGEITIFNKSDRLININKGLVISDSTGKSFITNNNILLPASTYNLDTGVINMGQVKAAVVAQNIGPEYNLATNTSYTTKENENILIKSSSEFTGGSRQEIGVVTQTDRTNLLDLAKSLLKERANNDINSQKSPQNTILDSTMVYDSLKTDFNREAGEQSDILTLNLSSKVSFLYFDLKQKQDIISSLFPQKPTLSILDKNTAVVSINYVPGKLTLSGKANPLININQLKSKITGKKESELKSILNSLPKYYQHSLSNSLWFINLLRILPIKPELINIIIKN